jgi:hypothetical protein
LESVKLYGENINGASAYVLSRKIDEYEPNPGAFPDINVNPGIYVVRLLGAIYN